LTDTLTESFCERCGTRYEFSAPTRLNPLRKTRGLIGGLKNYLTSQDALSDAIGDAMRGEEGALASAQLEAFHESFNFCIDCRQYTCVNCWNDDAGRCRSCAPIAGTDDLAERLEASLAASNGATPAAEPLLAGDDLQRRLGLDTWPMHDLPLEATNGHAEVAEPWPAAEAVGEAPEPPVAAPPFEPLAAERATEPAERYVAADGFVYETAEQAGVVSANLEHERHEAELAAAAAAAAAAAESVAQGTEADWEAIAAELAVEQAAAEADAEPAAGETTSDAHAERPPLRVVGWEEDAAYEVDIEPLVAAVEPEPEPMVAAVEPEPEPMVAAVEPEPEPIVAAVEPEPEPMVAAVEPEPEPMVEPPAPVAPRPIAPISETILHFPPRQPAPPPAAQDTPAVAAADESPELAARRAQLDLLGLGDPGEGPLAPETPAVLPYRSRGASVSPAELAVLAAQGQRFWEASAREVASAVGNVGIQNCGECGLSLSANARFCRRCGTRQARSA
jgi:hypothetical protein